MPGLTLMARSSSLELAMLWMETFSSSVLRLRLSAVTFVMEMRQWVILSAGRNWLWRHFFLMYALTVRVLEGTWGKDTLVRTQHNCKLANSQTIPCFFPLQIVAPPIKPRPSWISLSPLCLQLFFLVFLSNGISSFDTKCQTTSMNSLLNPSACNLFPSKMFYCLHRDDLSKLISNNSYLFLNITIRMSTLWEQESTPQFSSCIFRV